MAQNKKTKKPFKPGKTDFFGIGMSHNDIYRYIKKNDIEFVSYRIFDIFGIAHEVVFDAEYVFNGGKTKKLRSDFTLDGSSIRGLRQTASSGLVFSPPEYPIIYENLNARAGRTLIIETGVAYPKKLGGKLFENAPSTIVQKTEALLKRHGYAMMVGPEPEYFIRKIDDKNENFYDNPEILKTAKNTGYETNDHTNPFNQLMSDYRSRVSKRIKLNGVSTKFNHQEVVEGINLAQCENEIGADGLRRTIANVRILKFAAQGETLKRTSIMPETFEDDDKFAVTFDPKPIAGVNGSGMHVNVSLSDITNPDNWKNVFAGNYKDSGLSKTGYYALGGLITHAKALQAFANPSDNSFMRLVPGAETPTAIAWGPDNRTVAFRIPLAETSKAVRIEFRVPDPSANQELLFSTMAMAMLDGIIKEIPPVGFADDKDVYKLSDEEKKDLGIEQLAGSVEVAVKNLKKDYKFLIRENVFPEKFIKVYCDLLIDKVQEERKEKPVVGNQTRKYLITENSNKFMGGNRRGSVRNY